MNHHHWMEMIWLEEEEDDDDIGGRRVGGLVGCMGIIGWMICDKKRGGGKKSF